MINLCIGSAFWMIRLQGVTIHFWPPISLPGDPFSPGVGYTQRLLLAAPADLSKNAGLDATGWSGSQDVFHLEGVCPPFFGVYMSTYMKSEPGIRYYLYRYACIMCIATGTFGGFNIHRRIFRWLKSKTVRLVVSMDLLTPSVACWQAIHFVLKSWELPRPEIRILGSIKG